MATAASRPVPSHVRLTIALLVAIVAAHYVYNLALTLEMHRDMGQLWFAAREVLHGRDPYESIGPGRTYEWPWPLYYPMPAVLAALPLAVLREPMAMAVFSAISLGAFAWALAEYGYASLLALVSFSTWHATTLVQWSPLLAAAMVVSPLAALLVVKPTVGLAVFAGRPSRWAVGGAVLLTLASFIAQPRWVQHWLAALASPNVLPVYHVGHFAIVQFLGGPLVLLSLVRWRRPEARLLAVLACVPQTVLPYEATLLFLIPRGWLESASMVALSHAMFFVALRNGATGFVERTLAYGPAVTWTMYVPALLMVLRRPNEGSVPAWLERRVASLPAWLRGRDAS